MNIKLYRLYEYFLYIIVFLNLEFLNIFNNLNSAVANVTVILSVVLFIIYIFNFKEGSVKLVYGFIFCGLLLLFLIFQLFRHTNASFFLDYNIKNRVGLIKYYSYILLMFPIYETLNKRGNIFIRNIYILGMIALVLRIFVWTLYNKTGIDIMPGLFSMMGYSWSHGSDVRLPGTFLDGFLLTYSLSKIHEKLAKKESKIYPYIIGLIISLFYIYYVFNSRSQILCCLLVIVLSLVFVNNKILSTLAKILLVILCCFLIIKISSHTDLFKWGLNYYDPGTQVRITGFDFYHDNWINYKFLGFGIAPDGNMFHTWYNSWIYYLSDLGIVNILFQFGYIGLLLLFLPVVFAFFVGYKNVKYSNGYLLMLLSFYTIVLSILFQSVYDSSRILIVPFILAMMMIVNKE